MLIYYRARESIGLGLGGRGAGRGGGANQLKSFQHFNYKLSVYIFTFLCSYLYKALYLFTVAFFTFGSIDWNMLNVKVYITVIYLWLSQGQSFLVFLWANLSICHWQYYNSDNLQIILDVICILEL